MQNTFTTGTCKKEISKKEKERKETENVCCSVTVLCKCVALISYQLCGS